MELQKIVDSLQSYCPRAVSRVSGAAYIRTYKMLVQDQVCFTENCLYLGRVSDLPPSADVPQASSLICIEDIALPYQYNQRSDLNLYIIDEATSQPELLNRVTDIMADESRFVDSMRKLLDALHSNLGLQYIVDVASECFENPVFINDSAFKILAMSRNVVYGDHTLEKTKELGYIHEQNIGLMRKDRIFERLRDSEKPLFSHKSDDGVGWLMFPIKIHNVDVGMVALVENNKPFRGMDHELLEHFCKLVTIELEKNDFYKHSKGVIYSYLLADLFGNRIQNRVDIEQRLTYLGWKTYSYFQVMVVVDYKVTSNEETIERMGRQIRQILTDCHWTVLHQNLVVLLSRPQTRIINDMEKAVLSDFLKQNNLSAGISQAFHDILETPKYYRQALRGVELGTYVRRRSGIYEFSEYMLAYIAQVLSRKHNLLEFCHPAILLIDAYDQKNGTNLLETLERYLFYVNDLVSAAKDLKIHRNTLLYRINKIKEITDLDLANGDERLQVQMYFKFMDYMKGGWGQA